MFYEVDRHLLFNICLTRNRPKTVLNMCPFTKKVCSYIRKESAAKKRKIKQKVKFKTVKVAESSSNSR